MDTSMWEHDHPLRLKDLQPTYPNFEEEEDDDDDEEEGEEEDDDDNDELIKRKNFKSRKCFRCKEEINWFDRYYYECTDHSCDYYWVHKFCGELPYKLKHTSHPTHTLTLRYHDFYYYECTDHSCAVCSCFEDGLAYVCSSECRFGIHANCAMDLYTDRIIYHPSHKHPLAPMPTSLICKCNACGKAHEGEFYICTVCFNFCIHRDCAFLPQKLIIQDTTNGFFSHDHPLILSYSFSTEMKFRPKCRVCNKDFDKSLLWIYKCEKCRYYTHLHCATSREEPFMSIISSFGNRLWKNYKDSDYPDLVNLPFREDSDSVIKHKFLKQVGCETSKMEDWNLKNKFHQHPLIRIHVEASDDITKPTSSKGKTLSCHNPMKKIELLCNGCLRPITSVPFYKCDDEKENCNFVLHEWCTQLPDIIEEFPDHPQHTLIFYPNAPNKFFSVFDCCICTLRCNGFAYSCVECDYHIDVKCAFIPEKITHEAHQGHLLSRVQIKKRREMDCRLCLYSSLYTSYVEPFWFLCDTCDVSMHVRCALLLPRQIRHKYDKHPMSLSYFPVQNHRSDYFCEICEKEFNPASCFYHCYDGCAFSIHSTCAPIILQPEIATNNTKGVYYYVNIKFGGSYNFKGHPHDLYFVQGIKSDGHCIECKNLVETWMIFKCQQCKFAIHMTCCKRLSKS